MTLTATSGDAHTSRRSWKYLAQETALLILWAYVILAAGSITGLINYRLQLTSTVLAAVVIGGWLLGRALRGRRIPRTGIEWGLLAFLSAQLLAALLSQDVRRSLPVVAQYAVYAFVFYFAFDLLRSGLPAELVEKTLLIVGGIVVGFALLEQVQAYLAWRNLVAGLPFAPPFRHRLFSVFGEANLLAVFINLFLPLAIARAIVTPARVPRLLLVLLTLAALVVEYFASSRGGVLGALAAFGMLGVLWLGVVSVNARSTMGRAWAWLRARPFIFGGGALLALAPFAWLAVIALQFQGDATHGPLLVSRDAFWQAAWLGFRSEPLWGTGPGSYPTVLMWATSMPSFRPYLHAHSVPFTIAAESGLLGVIGLLALVFAVGWAAWRARRGLLFADRARWAAAVASLTGLATHSLVDDHMRFLAVGVPLVVLLAIVLSPPRFRGEIEGGNFHPLWLALPALASAGLAAYSLRAQALNEQSIDVAIAGNWAAAAEHFDQAAARDPGMALYWLESGFAYGMLAAEGGSDASLTTAIDRMEHGIALEPDYALHYANLAALYAQAGRVTDARGAMAQATERAPAAATFWLNAGVLAEQASDDDAARQNYWVALDVQPALADSAFWATAPLRADALVDWLASQPAVALDDGVHPTARARRAIEAGDHAAARRDLEAVWRQDANNSAVYLGLGELARAQGDLHAAGRYFQLAIWVQSQSNAVKVEPLLAWAELALEQGDTETALLRYEGVLAAVTRYTIYGWGTEGWNPYAWFVFQRRGLSLDVLPQLTRPEMTPEFAARLERLADLYEAQGKPEQARLVYERLAAILP